MKELILGVAVALAFTALFAGGVAQQRNSAREAQAMLEEAGCEYIGKIAPWKHLYDCGEYVITVPRRVE